MTPIPNAKVLPIAEHTSTQPTKTEPYGQQPVVTDADGRFQFSSVATTDIVAVSATGEPSFLYPRSNGAVGVKRGEGATRDGSFRDSTR